MVLIREDEFKELRDEVITEGLKLKEESVFKEKELTGDQKNFLDATKRNSKSEYLGLSVDTLIPFNDRLLIKVAIEHTTKGNIVVPTNNRKIDKGNAIVKYCEIVAISPKIKAEIERDYPGVSIGWRCKLNVNLALQIAGGPCLSESDDHYTYEYYTVSQGLIDYVYPKTTED